MHWNIADSSLTIHMVAFYRLSKFTGNHANTKFRDSVDKDMKIQ